jgi:hypothetical protein
MNCLSALRLGAAMCAMGFASVSVQANPPGDDPEVVVEWNELLESVQSPGGLSHPRQYAMLHVAMFDAINSITRTHRPYRVKVPAPVGACPEIAAAHAAHDVLAALFPASQSKFDAALQARMAAYPAWQTRSATNIGRSVAAAILAWRANDGWATPAPAFQQPPFPGLYQSTPPAFAPAAFRQFQHTAPFALLTPTQYLPGAPPSLTSERYAQDFNETKSLGALQSAVRTAEQTQLAQLFANVTSRTTHWALWNHVARDTARASGLSLEETARLFALINVAMHDGVQTSHASKFVYGAWRPVTAIHRADEDQNAQTDADPSWRPLLSTPPYPSHAGNMACVGASAARMLTLFNGSDEQTFTVLWNGVPGQADVARSYSRFTDLAQDQANSRIYGGIHFRYESEVSQESCPKVAEYVFETYMTPRQR